jgi:hypothetical protein
VESLVATAFVFVLIAMIVQVAFVVVARDAAQTAVTAAARRAGRPGADLDAERIRLADDLARIVPGATDVTASVETGSATVTARASMRWAPPGPDLIPVTLRADAIAPLVIPP